MKAFRVALLSFFVFTSAQGARADAASPSLRLTAEIVGRRYCAGEKVGILELKLRLRYHNAGGRRLIVYRGKNLFYQTKIRGGRVSLKRVTRRNFQSSRGSLADGFGVGGRG